MKRFLFLLISLLLFFAVHVVIAGAVPDIRGIYSGSYTTIVSNCTDSSNNGTYDAILSMGISILADNTFNGSATGTFNQDRLTEIEYIQFSGVISESGQISGTTSHTFSGTAGQGTFTGQFSGNTLTIENPGNDTYGDTCTYIRYISATRTDIPPYNEFKIRPSDMAADRSFGHSVSISEDYAISIASSRVGNGTPYGSAYFFERNGITWNQVAKLTANDGDFSISSVSISGGYAIVSGSYKHNSGFWYGSAYVFERSDGTWKQVAKLTADDGYYLDGFGRKVSISGGYAIVGAYNDDDNGLLSGSAYVFERTGSTWNQVDKLTASDGTAEDLFGFSVSISGEYTIVGAPSDDDNGTDSGSAYVFERSGNTWRQVAKLTADDGDYRDSFGLSVSISGEYAIVGAAYDDDSGSASGSAYVFERSGNTWKQVAKLTADDGDDGDGFGTRISISGGYAIVGAPQDEDNGTHSGSAYVFERTGSTWNQLAKLTANDGAVLDRFGWGVSISGGYVIVGAYDDDDNGTDYGSAYLFDLPKHSNIAMPLIPLLLLND